MLIYAGEPKIGLSLKLFLLISCLFTASQHIRSDHKLNIIIIIIITEDRGVLSCLQLSLSLLSSAVYLYFISAADAAAVYFVIMIVVQWKNLEGSLIQTNFVLSLLNSKENFHVALCESNSIV